MNASRLFKTLPFFLIGIGGIGFWGWCAAGWQPQPVRVSVRPFQRTEPAGVLTGNSGIPAKPAEASGPAVLPSETRRAAPAGPGHQAGEWRGGSGGRKELTIATASPRVGVPQSASNTGDVFPEIPPRKPGRTFTVPAALADQPLPVFIRFSGTVGESAVAGAGTLLPARPGLAALPSSQEQRVLAEAERIFGEAMELGPVLDATAPEYEDWWRAAQARSENYLRLSLGWDRFNTLTRTELKSLPDQSAAESWQAIEMESAGP